MVSVQGDMVKAHGFKIPTKTPFFLPLPAFDVEEELLKTHPCQGRSINTSPFHDRQECDWERERERERERETQRESERERELDSLSISAASVAAAAQHPFHSWNIPGNVWYAVKGSNNRHEWIAQGSKCFRNKNSECKKRFYFTYYEIYHFIFSKVIHILNFTSVKA